MSDGHFNRSFLPHTEFRNGFRAAQTRTRIFAIEAFQQWLKESGIDCTEEQVQQYLDAYTAILTEKIK